jgi:hypothetical protein
MIESETWKELVKVIELRDWNFVIPSKIGLYDAKCRKYPFNR